MELTKNKISIYIFLSVVLIFTLNFNNKVFAATTERISGSDRYATSLQISKTNWKNCDYAFIATGKDFPDALCATPLAKKYNAPIILVDGTSLSTDTVNELTRLGVKNVFIIGGTGAISVNVENILKNIGIKSTRLGGINRYETSLKIAEQIGTSTKVALATGDTFPDAISISAPAAIEEMPILLVNKNNIDTNISNYINSVQRDTVYIIGGSGVISDAVLNQFSKAKRLSGMNRIETNIAVINEFITDFNLSNVFVGTALDFPDGLSGSAAAAIARAPVLLVDQGYIDTTTKYISSKVDSSVSFKILGGIGAVVASVEQELGKINSKTVVIDPGHGGYDSGAVGPTKILEKDVNLAISLKLGAILKANGINVIYTRISDNVSWTTDITNDLQTRCDIANNANADFFICIHSNASNNNTAVGTETYYSRNKEKDKAIAETIQNALVAANGLSNRGAQTAGFYVLNNTKMPAVLVELGFISNPREEQLLNSADFQNKCAAGLSNGIISVLTNIIN